MGPIGRGLKGGFSNDEEGKEVEDEERRRRKMAKWGIFSLAETLLITPSKSLWKFPIQK